MTVHSAAIWFFSASDERDSDRVQAGGRRHQQHNESGSSTALDSWAVRGALHLSFLSKRPHNSRVASDCPDPARPGSAVQQGNLVASDQGRVGKLSPWVGATRFHSCFTTERPVASPGALARFRSPPPLNPASLHSWPRAAVWQSSYVEPCRTHPGR